MGNSDTLGLCRCPNARDQGCDTGPHIGPKDNRNTSLQSEKPLRGEGQGNTDGGSAAEKKGRKNSRQDHGPEGMIFNAEYQLWNPTDLLQRGHPVCQNLETQE